MSLEERFYKIASHWFKDQAQQKKYWSELSKKYNESFRKYHNFNHLEELFKYFDAYQQKLKYPNEVAYAIFYHDIIYNIWSKKNELNSAELAKAYLSNLQSNHVHIERIFNLIMVTKDHSPNENDDEKWMVDFDIAILGQPWEIYFQYTKDIREEYASVPTFIYKKGRRKVLNHFLNKNRLYQTAIFYELYEEAARSNIKKELDTL